MAALHENGACVALFIVDGTHSSGKSTLLEDYLGNRPLLTDDYIGLDGTIPGNQYPFSCVGEAIDGATVPVVVVREAARQYASWNCFKDVLVEDYSYEDQAAITFLSGIRISRAALMAGAMAAKLQPEREHPVAAIISDRSPISGFVYAETRLPDQNHNYASLSTIAEASNGLLMAAPNQPDLALRQIADNFAANFDEVFVTDHTQIDLEVDGFRSADKTLRDVIAKRVTESYTDLLGIERVTRLSGDRPTRTAELQQNIRHFIGHLIAYKAL